MNYNNLMLLALGLLGILAHNFMKMNDINRSSNGDFKLGQYLKIERFSIYVSIIVVIVCLIAKTEITQLEKVGKWLGLSFVAIGYMGQSIIVRYMGKAEKQLDKNDKES